MSRSIFADTAIGRQRWVHESHPQAFRRDIARARTFGFMRDVEHLWKVPVSRSAPPLITPSLFPRTAWSIRKVCGSRTSSCATKLLDAIGDLALAGYPVLGAYRLLLRGGGATASISPCWRPCSRSVPISRSSNSLPGVKMPAAMSALPLSARACAEAQAISA